MTNGRWLARSFKAGKCVLGASIFAGSKVNENKYNWDGKIDDQSIRSVTAGRARLSPGRRSRNQSGARTFLSAATSNGSRALEPSDPVEHSGVAADKNVRAPVASPKSSRFAQTFAYSNSAGRSAGRGISRRAG